MANGGWSSSMGMNNTLVGGLATGTCNNGNNTLVAGLMSDLRSTCFGPPFFFQKLRAFQGVPVCICTENSRCVFGQIMEVCADYITFNNNGNLEVIPIFQITRISLAPLFGSGQV